MALYKVHVQGVDIHPELLKVVRYWDIGGLLCQISGTEEIDLLYHLTSRKSPLTNMMKKHPDGKYRMLVWRESMASHYARKHGLRKQPSFAWQGWALFTKNKDVILFDTRWFQIGNMNAYNLMTDPRDVQEEVRRKHWGEIPGGGLPVPFAWDKDREDAFEQKIKSEARRVY